MSGTMNSAQLILKLMAVGLSNVLGLSTADDSLTRDYSLTFSGGTGAGQVSNMWHDQRTIALSSSETLDLVGSLVNAFGVTLTFTKIRALLIFAAVANTNDVVVGGVGANAWLGAFGATTDTIKVHPGGLLLLTAPAAAGMAVVATTGDLLKVANGGAGTSVLYDVVILGVD